MNVLFVCTGNSCRSQMAEGWARVLAPHCEANSAGLEAHGLNPRAVAAMARQGVDIGNQTSDVLDDEMIERADLIVTVCSHADANCPIVPPGKRKLHLPFDDPAGFTGPEEEVRAGFDRVCLEIRKGVEELLAMPGNLDPEFGHEHVEVLSRKPLHAGYIRVDELILRHRLFAGGDSEPFRRELIVRPRGVGVLLYDPERREAVLVRQFRVGMIDEPRSPWMLELIAGMVDEGEDPLQVAHRESREESGIEPVNVVRICDYYNSPGVGNERITLFCGRVDSSSAGGIHGLNEEHEDIEVVVVPYDDLITAVESGQINNAMTIIAIQWLQLHHSELLSLWACTD